MALHHTQLKAAVKKYQPLIDSGKSIEDVTTEINLDEKGYTPTEAQEIVAALQLSQGGEKTTEETTDNSNDTNQESPIQDPPPPPPTLSPDNGTSASGESTEAGLGLEKFDYKNLKGKSFKEYVELVGDRSYVTVDEETGKEIPVVGQLKQDAEYDFEQYRAKPVFKMRFAGVPNTPMDFNGIELVKDAPEHTTRISVGTALELNSQILNGHSRAGHGRYYLLAKKQRV